MRAWLLLVPVLLLAAGTAFGKAVRGNYSEAGGVAWFQPCGSRDRLKVSGESAAEELSASYAVLSHRASGRIYAEVRGQRRGGVLVVSGLERIQGEGEGIGCHEVLRNTLFKAYGPEPMWNLYVDYTGLRLKTLVEAQPERFPYRRYRRIGDAWVFESRNGTGPIRVELSRRRCIDPASGARYSFAAEVAYGDKRYTGCAYPGTLFR